MSANYHSQLTAAMPADSLLLEIPLGQLDQGITDLATRVTAVEAVFAGTDGYDLINLGAGSELTIASGAITISGSRHTVDTEGDAATDNLKTINASDGDVFVLSLENAARDVVIQHGVDNIICIPAIDFTLDTIYQYCRCFSDGTYTYVFTPSTQAEAVALLQDQKAQNTDGGTFTLGAWRTRVLNTKVSDANVICSITKLPFTSGGTAEIEVGDTITGATSGETATVFDVELTGGAWAAGTAAGNLWLNDQSGAFVAENLNTPVQANIATIAADSTYNEVRLKSGTYRFEGGAPAFRVNKNQARIQNTTDATTAVTGLSCYSGDVGNYAAIVALVYGRTTITASKTFELQHYSIATYANTGFGLPCNITTEVYSTLKIIKEL